MKKESVPQMGQGTNGTHPLTSWRGKNIPLWRGVAERSEVGVCRLAKNNTARASLARATHPYPPPGRGSITLSLVLQMGQTRHQYQTSKIQYLLSNN